MIAEVEKVEKVAEKAAAPKVASLVRAGAGAEGRREARAEGRGARYSVASLPNPRPPARIGARKLRRRRARVRAPQPRSAAPVQPGDGPLTPGRAVQTPRSSPPACRLRRLVAAPAGHAYAAEARARLPPPSSPVPLATPLNSTQRRRSDKHARDPPVLPRCWTPTHRQPPRRRRRRGATTAGHAPMRPPTPLRRRAAGPTRKQSQRLDDPGRRLPGRGRGQAASARSRARPASSSARPIRSPKPWPRATRRSIAPVSPGSTRTRRKPPANISSKTTSHAWR